MTPTWKALAPLLVAALAAAGCGGGPVRVEGTVTVDGKPLPKGLILLEAQGGGDKMARAFAEVADGRFAFPDGKHDLRPGAYRVEVRSPQQTGKWVTKGPTEPPTPEVKEQLPAKFHERSELKADLRPGANVLTFDLKTNE